MEQDRYLGPSGSSCDVSGPVGREPVRDSSDEHQNRGHHHWKLMIQLASLECST